MTAWPTPPLGALVHTIVPARDKPIDLTGPIPWLRIEDFGGKYIGESRSGQGVSEATVAEMNLRVFPAGTVVCSCSCDMGTTAITRRPLITNQTFIGLTPHSSRVVADFLYYSLQAHRSELNAMATGAIQSYLSRDDFRALRLPLPRPQQQQAIADFLDAETARIDALVEKKRRIISLLADREAALVESYVDSCFQQYGSMSLRHGVATIDQGWSPQCEDVTAEASEWGVLRTSAVSSGMFLPTENKRLPNEIEPDLRWAVRDGDLLITRGSGSRSLVGQAVVAQVGDRRLMVSDLVYRVRLRNQHPEFVAAVLRAPRLRSRIESSVRSDAGLTLKIRVDDIKELPIPAMPFDQQKSIWVELNTRRKPLTGARESIQHQIALLAERRQTLITAAVTGQLDIAEAAA